jgi:hypothetical protein
MESITRTNTSPAGGVGHERQQTSWGIWLAVALLCQWACNTDRVIPVHAPLADLKIVGPWFMGQRLEAYVSEGSSLHDAARLQMFSPLGAGVTLSEAQSRLGPPKAKRVDSYGVVWSEYRNEFGRLEVGEERAGSAERGAGVVGWRTYLEPSDGAPSRMFDTQIASAISPAVVEILVSARQPHEHPRHVWCQVDHGTLRRCTWYEGS